MANIKIYGFAAEHEQGEDEAFVFPVNVDCESTTEKAPRLVEPGVEVVKVLFDAYDEEDYVLVKETLRPIGKSLSAESAQSYMNALCEMWWAWQHHNSESYKSQRMSEVSNEMFAGPTLSFFGNGNYEKILLIAVDEDAKTYVGHAYSDAAPISNPCDGWETLLTEGDFDERQLLVDAWEQLVRIDLATGDFNE